MEQYIHGGKTLTKESKYMDKNIKACRDLVIKELEKKMKVKIAVVEKIMLAEITDSLRRNFPTEEWTHEFEKSYIKPDGGILYLKSHNNDLYPILIIEWKNKEQMIE